MQRYTLFIPPELEDCGIVAFESEVDGEKAILTPKVEYYEPMRYTRDNYILISAKEGLALHTLEPHNIHIYFFNLVDTQPVYH